MGKNNISILREILKAMGKDEMTSISKDRQVTTVAMLLIRQSFRLVGWAPQHTDFAAGLQQLFSGILIIRSGGKKQEEATGHVNKKQGPSGSGNYAWYLRFSKELKATQTQHSGLSCFGSFTCTQR